MDDIVFVVQPKTYRISDLTPQAVRLLHFSSGEILSMNLRDLFPSTAWKQLLTSIKLAQRKSQAHIDDITINRKDASPVPVRLYLKCTDDDEALRVQIHPLNYLSRTGGRETLRELTELKKAYRRLVNINLDMRQQITRLTEALIRIDTRHDALQKKLEEKQKTIKKLKTRFRQLIKRRYLNLTRQWSHSREWNTARRLRILRKKDPPLNPSVQHKS